MTNEHCVCLLAGWVRGRRVPGSNYRKRVNWFQEFRQSLPGKDGLTQVLVRELYA